MTDRNLKLKKVGDTYVLGDKSFKNLKELLEYVAYIKSNTYLKATDTEINNIDIDSIKWFS